MSVWRYCTGVVSDRAYEGAFKLLRLVDCNGRVTKLLAKKIIEIAQIGERNPQRLLSVFPGLNFASQCPREGGVLGAIGAGVGVGVVGSLVAGDLDVGTSDRVVVLEGATGYRGSHPRALRPVGY